MNIGFLVVDMQKIFLDELREKINVQRAVEHINYVSEMLRSKGHCIVHIQDIEDENENNSHQIDFIPEIVIAERDLRLKKIKSNSFMDTDLEKLLKDKEVELIIVSYTVWIIFFIFIVIEFIFGFIKIIQSAFLCTDPEISMFVLANI